MVAVFHNCCHQDNLYLLVLEAFQFVKINHQNNYQAPALNILNDLTLSHPPQGSIQEVIYIAKQDFHDHVLFLASL